MKTRRQKKWQARLIVREYTDLLNRLTALDPDFRFERACCGEVQVRARYSKEALKNQIQDIYLLKLKALSPYVGGAMGQLTAAAMQQTQTAVNKTLTELANKIQPGRIEIYNGIITNYDPTHLYK